MFAGTYQHTLDTKNRIVVPSDHRSVITDPFDQKGFYVSLWQLGEIRCLSLFTRSAWQDLMNRLEARASADEAAEAYLTKLSSNAKFSDRDPEWRIVIPEKLIASVQLGREVVLVGRKWQILVMNPEPWQRFDAQIDRDYPEVYKKVLRVPK